MQDEMAACISHYLYRLPERQRNVLALHDMGGIGHKDLPSPRCCFSSQRTRASRSI
jgi:hypothetical protein